MTAKGLAAVVGAIATCCMVAPAGAGASTTIGADLSVDPVQACGAGTGEFCNFTSLNLPSGAPDTGSPVAGILVSVRVRSAGAATDLTLRVLRQNTITPSEFLNVGPDEAIVPVTADATTEGHITERAGLHMPVAVGDRLGVGYVKPASFFSVLGNHAAASCYFRQGAGLDHPVGTERGYSGGCLEPLLQGTVEPDADGDLYGDESQDLCPGNAALQTACPVPAQPQPKKKKCKKAKKKSAAAAKKKCKKKKKS